MNIKEFERQSGLPRSTIRFYEQRGLLAPNGVGRANGYRSYTAKEVDRGVGCWATQYETPAKRHRRQDKRNQKEGLSAESHGALPHRNLRLDRQRRSREEARVRRTNSGKATLMGRLQESTRSVACNVTLPVDKRTPKEHSMHGHSLSLASNSAR
jgi:hypothetical protein